MSHFRVFVIHKPEQNYEDLLTRYDENLETEPRIEYTRQQAIEYARRNYKDMQDKSDDECWKYVAEDYTMTDDDGNIYTTYNPDSKWDWYQEGGRFGSISDDEQEIKVKDFKLKENKERYKHSIRFWEVAIEGKPLKPGETERDFIAFYRKEYYLERYKNKQTFASYCSSEVPYAIVTSDGEWHAQGEMGWFGCSDDSYSAGAWMRECKRILREADPEDLIISIDCHI